MKEELDIARMQNYRTYTDYQITELAGPILLVVKLYIDGSIHIYGTIRGDIESYNYILSYLPIVICWHHKKEERSCYAYQQVLLVDSVKQCTLASKGLSLVIIGTIGIILAPDIF